jgi:hypothetical protein
MLVFTYSGPTYLLILSTNPSSNSLIFFYLILFVLPALIDFFFSCSLIETISVVASN